MPRNPVPPELGDTFTVHEAGVLGVTAGRLRGADLVTPFPGVRVRGHVGDLIDTCRAYAKIAPAPYCFSHSTAARLHGMPLPLHLEREKILHVTVPAAAAQPRGSGVRGHRISVIEPVNLLGLPVATAVVTWVQLAAGLNVDELVVAGDYLVRRRRPLSSLAEMTEAVRGGTGQRGVATARLSLLDIRAGTDSPRESAVRLVLIRAGLPEPRIGLRVIDADGYFVGTPDLAYPHQRIAVEYEGDIHRLSRRTFMDDIERRELFELAGWRVVRVTDDLLRQPHRLVERVARLLRERART